MSNAGGLGSFAAQDLAPEAIRDAIRRIRSLTSRPFAVNLFAPLPAVPRPSAEELERARRAVAPFRAEVGIGDPATAAPPASFEEALRTVLDERVPAATTPREARALEAAGCHAVLAEEAVARLAGR